jgi:hypothetical protein
MTLQYRDFTDEELQKIVAQVEKLTFRSLGRTIKVQTMKYPWWQFWQSRLSLRIDLTNNSRQFLHSALHGEILNYLLEQVPKKTTVENVIMVNGKVDHTAAVMRY